jgi:hypothetical protein
MGVLNTMVVFIVMKMFMFKGICIKLYGFLKYFKNSIPHQNVHNNNVNTCCHVYMQNILIAGIGTFNYHVTIIFFKHMFIIDIFCS